MGASSCGANGGCTDGRLACCAPRPEVVKSIDSVGPTTNAAFVQQSALLSKKADGSQALLDGGRFAEAARIAHAAERTTGRDLTSEVLSPQKVQFVFGRSESSSEQLMKQSDRAGHAVKANVLSKPEAPTNERGKVTFSCENEVIHMEASVESEDDANAVTYCSPLELETVQELKKLFECMDLDGSGEIQFDEAMAYFNTSLASAASMFQAVDMDGDGNVTISEFMSFWQLVKQDGWSDTAIQSEIKSLLDGTTWRLCRRARN
eukprot:TRINITY_DN24499_c0_g1_i2.p1 TRINITY_DN24499_c0_g1~~TRINITY_DN24499_c0_g1_i2.p1  ORF type:complete len:263 (-),score=57.52 TRINITY_DN24499_c0_g1_i2:203-991(-)